LLCGGGLCLASIALSLLAVVALLVASHCEKVRNVGVARMRVVGGNETGFCSKIRRLVVCET
jgi:3-polyprenyl-4-hydroxybenzoate decarboxylase